ncbi:MAG: heavy metal translocating P-type ATPase [Victivallaceae bacterium]|nr:heavy metal translocating P-type ATPase [Victivallaceae bacterium]
MKHQHNHNCKHEHQPSDGVADTGHQHTADCNHDHAAPKQNSGCTHDHGAHKHGSSCNHDHSAVASSSSEPLSSNQTAYKVFGLDCPEEIAILNKEVGKKPGIVKLDFDILNAKMTVTIEPGTSGNDDIIAAVAAGGMRAVLWDEWLSNDDQETFWQQHGRTITTIISGMLLVTGFGIHWYLHGSFMEAFVAGDDGKEHIFPLSSIVLYCIAIIAGGWFVAPKALGALRRLRLDMNFLMVVAVVGAIIIGEWFEATTVTFLFSLSLLLEHWSIGRAQRAVTALMDLAPAVARYRCPHDGDIMEVPVAEVPLGVNVLVRPGEKIPLDGEVTTGSSGVNQAPITGESVPVFKEAGDEVFAGTINENGSFEFKVTKLATDTTLARIIQMIQEARSRRASSEQWVETFAKYYTPAMILFSLLIMLVPPLLFSALWVEWIYRGLVILVIACPCALVISTPVSIVSGLTAAARNGVLIKGGMYLELIGQIRALAMDKTGTLTFGHPEVQTIIPLNGHSRQELLERAAALEAHSEHPLARAVLRCAETEQVEVKMVAENFQAVKGKGAEADIDGRKFWIGSHRFMEEKGEETPEIHQRAQLLEDEAHSVIAIGNEDHVCGLISVADGVRPAASVAVANMKRLGLERLTVLTGDNAGTGNAVGAVVGIEDIRTELLPEDKVAGVEELVEKYEKVAMIGDGVNDAPAMAVASLGIAMGAIGSDVAIETADIALMADDLNTLPWLISHSRRTLNIIKQNIWFALGLKVVFMALAMTGMATLWMAIVADTGASLLVIFNALRLLKSSHNKE